MKEKETTEQKLNTIKLIRTVKQIKVKEMADLFGVTTAYISALEKGIRNIKVKTLKHGLENLGISYEKYEELEVYKQYLSKLNISDDDKYTIMLIKTIAITTPSLETEAETTLSKLESRIPNTSISNIKAKEEKKLSKEEIIDNLKKEYGENLMCMFRLYKNYKLVNSIIQGNIEENRAKLQQYENSIYTINGKTLSENEKIRITIEIIKNKLQNEINMSIYEYAQIARAIQTIQRKKINNETDIFTAKKQISLIQAKLGMKNTFFEASYQLFIEICQNLNKNKEIENIEPEKRKEYK